MKAIVTGAAGFLGRYCSKELASQGYQVIGLDIVPFENFKEWGLSTYIQTECKTMALKDATKGSGAPEVIIHCAGSGSVPHSYQSPYQDFVSNVNTTLEVLEYCRTENPNIKLVIPSSAAVYGVIENMPIAEESPLSPVSPYGFHKKIIEDLANSYSTNFKTKVCLVRLFSLYGKGLKKQILWDACEKAAANNFNFSGRGEEVRDFLHVTDAARLLVFATNFSTDKCVRINGGTGVGMRISEILKLVGSHWSPQKQPVFSQEARIGDPANYIADTTQLKDWGFTPGKSLEEEIKNYIKWYKEEKKHG
jgi:UDP-glucose 4-epimerase